MSGKAFLLVSLVVSCLLGCAAESACLVESGVGVDYCVADVTRAACNEHGVKLSSSTITHFKRTSCDEEGFPKVCDGSDVSVAEKDECTEIGEPWAVGESETDDDE